MGETEKNLLGVPEESCPASATVVEYSSPLSVYENKRANASDAQDFSGMGKINTFNRPRNRPQVDKNSEREIPNNKRPPPVEDDSIPSEVMALLQTNLCGLCDLKLNSRVQSKSHYDGKPHARKLKAAIERHNQKNATPLSSIVTNPQGSSSCTPPVKKKKKTVADVTALFCTLCELSFTSTEHATQHYMGRNHQRVLHGLKPLKAGYYNKETGKWQRKPVDPKTSTELLHNSENPADKETTKDKGRFFCELCSISTTCQEQLDKHFEGQKHRKNKQAAERGSVQSVADNILSCVSNGEDGKRLKSNDLSVFRTPSGKFYCASCDIALNSENQFAQHIESKKHKKKQQS